MSNKVNIFRQALSEGLMNEIPLLWTSLSPREKEEVSDFLKQTSEDEMITLIAGVRLINEHIANEMIELAEFDPPTFFKKEEPMDQKTECSVSKSKKMERVLNLVDIDILDIQRKAKILGEFQKELKEEGIKDKATIMRLLVSQMEGMVYNDS